MQLSHGATIALLFSNLIETSLACLPGITRRETSDEATELHIRVAPRPPKTTTALVNVKVFDGYDITETSTVYFDGDTIVADPSGADNFVDGRGGILLPGLIASHCHPTTYTHLEALSSYGVTTAMSMACHNYQLCAALRDQVGLTSFFTAGQPAQGPDSAHAIQQHTPQDLLVRKPEQAPSFVQWLFNNGSDYLKITSEENGPDQATQNALVTHAHAIGCKVMTHAAEHAYYMMAINSKTNGPQHIPYDKLLSDDALAQMNYQNQYATPIMNLYKIVLQDPTALNPNYTGIKYEDAYEIVQENVRGLRRYGVPILAGTDASQSIYPVGLPFGSTLHSELENLVEVGFSPAEALRSATLVPALAHELSVRGRIVVGRRADLVLLQPDADPTRNISDTTKIARVWNGGIEYPMANE